MDRNDTHGRRLDNDGCGSFRVILITRFTLTVTWWTFFFRLISAKPKHSFLYGSKQTALVPELLHSYHRSQGESLSVHSHQTQNWTPTHHFQRGNWQGMLAAWGSPRYTGARAGGSREGGLGSLGQEAVGKISWGGPSPGLEWTPWGRTWLCVESQRKRPEDDWLWGNALWG